MTEEFSEQQIPPFIPYSNEKIRIETTTGSIVGQAIIEEKQAKFQNCNATTNETYLVQLKDLDTIQTMLASDTPQQSYEEAKNAGDIVIEGKSAWNKAKLSALNYPPQQLRYIKKNTAFYRQLNRVDET